jgi:hypothetical protein
MLCAGGAVAASPQMIKNIGAGLAVDRGYEG